MRRATHPRRRGILLLSLLLGAIGVAARSVQLQVVEHEAWVERAGEQHAMRLTLPAPRGAIYDRGGVPLAVSQSAYRIAIAPHELHDPAEAGRKLGEVLGLSEQEARRAVDPARRWTVLPGLYGAPVRDQLGKLRGVHFEQVLTRYHPHGVIGLELMGVLSADERPLGGLELEFDSVLTGRPGSAVVRRDARGIPIPGAVVTIAEPVPGRDIYLTIDFDLQEIAHEALRQAIEETGSVAGDLLLLDPWSGELLAAASRQTEGNRRWTAVTDPFEPGSTLKPFTVAALLAKNRVSMQDSVYADSGRYVHEGRTITDVHGYGWLTVHEALQRSSNVALAKLAPLLRPTEQFAVLRDFGLGTPTGVEYPSESSGLLRRPDQWSRYSQASLAIGYEASVTPLQLALAYGALANGGTLMEPRLVREVRSPGAETMVRFEPAAVRRVVPRAVASEVSAALIDAVRDGTGQRASLGAFQVAGKTGTARSAQGGAGYRSGAYNSTFAGFFPAVDPQLVFLVKLDRPQGAYYGGLTAAPVTRETLAAALSTHSTHIDRRAIARSSHPDVETAHPTTPRAADIGGAAASSGPFIFALDAGPPRRLGRTEAAAERAVPDLAGLSMRDAARRLHAQGFRVEAVGSGSVRRTLPSAAERAPAGSIVRLVGSEEAS